MGVPLTLRDIQSGFLSASAFNANNSLVEAALNRAVDRQGLADNAMEVDFDMGLNRISNLLAAQLQHQGVNLGQVRDEIAAVTTDITSTTDIEDRIFATAGQTTVNLTNVSYLPGTNSLMVFKNGIYQRAVWEYVETDSTTITFNTPLSLNDEIDIFGAKFNAELFATIAQEGADTTTTNVTESEVLLQETQDAAGYKLNVNTQTVTDYTLDIEDEGDLIRMLNGVDNTVTVPPDSSVDFEVGSIVLIRQVGAGLTTIVPGAGVTINAAGGELTTAGEEFGVGLVKVGPNEYDLVRSYSGVSPASLTDTEDAFDVKLADLEATVTSNDASLQGDIDSLQDQLTLPGAKSTNGYQYLPGGLILQWGEYAPGILGNNVTFNITFPVANPTSTLQVILSDTIGQGSASSSSRLGMHVESFNTTTATIRQQWQGWDSDGAERAPVRFFVIGY